MIDRFAGLTPTQSGFTTAPTNLANATDGDWSTATGVGVTDDVAAYNNGGFINIDMGAVYSIHIRGLFISGHSNAGGQSTNITVQVSNDNVNWFYYNSEGGIVSLWSDATLVTVFGSCFVRGRYVRFFSYNRSADIHDTSIGIYEVQAIDLGT